MNAVKVIFVVQIAFVVAQHPSSRYNCEQEEQCVLAKECHAVRALLREGKRPKVCGFDRESPKVCCPPETYSGPTVTEISSSTSTSIVSQTSSTTIDGIIPVNPWQEPQIGLQWQITERPVTEDPAPQSVSSLIITDVRPIATTILNITSSEEEIDTFFPKVDTTSTRNESQPSDRTNVTDWNPQERPPPQMAILPVNNGNNALTVPESFPPLAQPDNSDLLTNPPEATTNSAPVPIRTTPAALRVRTGCKKVLYTPQPGFSRHARVARAKCYEYSRAVFYKEDISTIPGALPECRDSCSTYEPLILGGKEAESRQFPHMALIGYGKYTPNNNASYYCGGSLISEKFVLSAGHCAYPQSSIGMPTWVRLGELDLSTETDAWPYDILINDVILHPEYTTTTMYNDLALFELTVAVSFSPDVRPACLKVTDNYEPKAIASGWGSTYYGGWRNDQLKYVALNLTSATTCNASYASLNKLPFGILPASQICAGDTYGEDSCRGDSGGPLQVALTEPYCMYDIIGITSFGKQCGYTTPGVYTKVAGFIPWIVENVWPDEIEKEKD